MSEKDIQNAIVAAIFAWGGWATSVQAGALTKSYRTASGQTKFHKITLARKGTPDILACIKGRFVAIEVKKDQKEVTKWRRCNDIHSQIQFAECERIDEAGGLSIVTCSVEDVESDLKLYKLI